MNHPIEKVILFFVICLLLGGYCVAVSGDETDNFVTYTVTIDTFTIEQIDGYDIISCPGFGHLLVEGKPNLPSKIFSIAIPPGATILDVSFTTSDCITLDGSYSIAPCPAPQIIGEIAPSNAHQQIFNTNYVQTYSSDESYPSKRGEYLRNSHFRKYDMVDVRINPFCYFPLSQRLDYYPTITISVRYELSEDASALDDMLTNKEMLAEQIICNYQQAKDWYKTSGKSEAELHDYVIITLDSLENAVEPLVDWEIYKGRSVKVVNTSWIETNYDGKDLQQQMRNFLRDKYPTSEWGISDVLLVGSYDDVPLRRCEQDTGYGKPRTDYYYAELSLPDNASWDVDNDSLYGESDDPIDFYGEVTVGRIPSSNVSIVSSICNKSIFYEQSNDPDFKENILLLGAYYWDDTDNAELMEDIANQSWMANWTITKMYEKPQSSYPSDYDLTYANVLSNWSASTYGYVNWAGHGSPDAAYELYPSQPFVNINTCNSLNDAYSAIVFAAACSNHDTDSYNIGQALMTRGAVGFLGATKVAYGQPAWDSAYDGSTQSLDYFFTTQVTSCNYSAGQAHQWALIEMYTHGLWWNNYYETFEWGAYLGNPDLWMKTSPVLSYSPSSLDFGIMQSDTNESITFELWNNGSGNLHYEIYETCEWLEVSPTSGISEGEHDIITVTVDTTGLAPGGYHHDILISTIEAGKDLFAVDLYIPLGSEIIDIEQNVYDRGFPIRHTIDGDWAAAQNVVPTITYMSRAELLIRKFGMPEFDLTIELRTDSPTGPLLDTAVIDVVNISTSWDWVGMDFTDVVILANTEYFLVCPPAPSGVTTSYGYEWGYAFGNLYDNGAFWFTRNGGELWRDLPAVYDFAFRIYGY